jgi:hypothetical protein
MKQRNDMAVSCSGVIGAKVARSQDQSQNFGNTCIW